ncbi:MAG: polysaccharide biosynthesis tyrosine autokinase, partial [Longimicrobiaceae bacterium]
FGDPWGGGARPVRPSDRFRLGDVTLELTPSARLSPPTRLVIEVLPFRRAVEQVRETQTVSLPNRDAQVVAVSFQSSDSILAAKVPNAYAGLFIRHKALTSSTDARGTVDFIKEQAAIYQDQLAQAEVALRDFREQQQVVSPEDQASAQVQRLAELQAERDALEVERQALSRLLQRVTATSSGPGDTSPYRQLASFPAFFSNQAVQDILLSINQLETDRSEQLTTRTEEFIDVQSLDRRIGELEGQLYSTARNYLANLETRGASLDGNLARFGEQLEAIPAREIEFFRLSRQQGLLEEIYTLLQTRLTEAEIQQAAVPGNVRILDPALIPQEPFAPRPMRTLLLAGMLGLLLGTGAAFLREALDTKVRSKEDVETATGGMPILGFVPRIRPPTLAAAGNGRQNGRFSGSIRRLKPEALLEERLVTHLDPRSPPAEAYRTLRTNITFSSAERAPRLLLVTSSMPADGKSTSAANLAITLAQQGIRTLLLDADLRKGLLHKVFNVPQEPGLSHLLLERNVVEECLQELEIGRAEEEPYLHLLPTGVYPPNPSEMLGSPRMKSLLGVLRARFQMVVLDAPPVNLVTDATILGKLVDSTVLITRTGETDKRALEHAAAQLRHLRIPVGGVVLNDIDLEGRGRYYGYGYYAYDS